MPKLNAEVIEGLVESVLAKNYDERVGTPEFHREMWRLCCDKHRFVAIAAPRGFAKSTAITHAYTLASVLFRERSFIVLLSDTETQAVMFLGDIKKELETNDDLVNLFGLKKDALGKTKFLKDTESDIIVPFKDGDSFRIVAKGSEQKIRGLKWGNKRPDLIICDDLENDEIVLNKERREKFKRWFLGALLPVRSDNGIIRVVGTILHMDSLLETLMPEHQLAGIRKHHLLKRDPLKEWTSIKLPWLSVKYKAHTPCFEHLLWSEKKSAEWLQDERKKYIAQGLPEVYSQEYLNVPIDESFALFRKSDFLTLRPEDLAKNVNYYITVDLAVSEKNRADYSVFTVGAVDYDGCLQIRNVIRDRLDGKEIVDLLIHLQRQYQPVAVGVEEGMIQKSILPFLKEQMLVSGQFLSLFPLKPSIDKVTRCRSIQARMRAGGVRFNKDAEWYPDLESECLRFPRDRHDDQVDSLSYLGMMLNVLQESQTPQEIEKENIDDELREAGFTSHGKDGRCETTGY